jgi:hypothetical protein
VFLFEADEATDFGRDGHPVLKSNPDGHVQADFWKAEGWEE